MAQRYRQAVGPVGVETRMPSSGSAELGDLLSRAAKGVQSQAVAVGSELRMNEAAAQGQKDGFAGKPKPVSGLAALTPWGKGYNSAAEAAYSAKVQTDVAATIDELAAKHEADPEGMQAAIDAVAVQMYDGVPEQYRPWVGAMLKGKTRVAVSKANEQLRVRTENETLAAAFEGSNSAAAAAIEAGVHIPGKEGDDLVLGYVIENRRRLEVMAKEGLIKATDVVKYDAAFREAVDRGISDTRVTLVSDAIATATREDAEKGASLLQAAMASEDLTEPQKAQVAANWQKANSAEHAKNAVLFADEVANVGQRIASGETGGQIRAELKALRRRNALTPSGYADKMAAVARNEKEKVGKEIELSALEIVQSEGGVMDPGNPKHKKAVDTLFRDQAAASGYARGSNEWKTLAVDTLRKSNIFPESAQAFIRATSPSANPESAALAASFYAEAYKANPTAMRQEGYDAKLDSYLLQIDEAVSAGGNYISTVERVNDLVYNTSKEKEERLRGEYAKQKAPVKNKLALANRMRGGKFDTEGLIFSSQMQPSGEMLDDYERLVRSEFVYNGGKLAEAQEKAANDVTSIYRVSDVNGSPEIMKWAPQLPTDILRKDIDETVIDAGYPAGTKAALSPSSETDPSMGLVWDLVAVDENGRLLDRIRDPRTGYPIRWRVPGADAYDRAEEKVRADKRAEAQQIRENEQIVEQATDQLFSNPNPRMLQ